MSYLIDDNLFQARFLEVVLKVDHWLLWMGQKLL